MNVTINRAEMLSAIKRASAIAPADSPLDVLRGVLLEADAAAGKLTVTSTNLEAALEEKLPCAVQENGALVFGAKMLAEMLSRLPQDTVQLCRTENQGRMTLRSGDACYEVDVWERGAFPKPDLPFPEDIQKLLEAFDKEESIDLSIIDWDAFQIENVTPENYERVYHRVFDGWIQGFIHYCRKAPVFQRQERSFF